MLVESFIYELPFGPKGRWLRTGVGRWLLGGWQANGIYTAQSGGPLNFTYSATTLNAPSNSNRPNITGQPTIFGAAGVGQKWLDVTKFSAPPTRTRGRSSPESKLRSDAGQGMAMPLQTREIGWGRQSAGKPALGRALFRTARMSRLESRLAGRIAGPTSSAHYRGWGTIR